jgi:hypothetical protein
MGAACGCGASPRFGETDPNVTGGRVVGRLRFRHLVERFRHQLD